MEQAEVSYQSHTEVNTAKSEHLLEYLSATSMEFSCIDLPSVESLMERLYAPIGLIISPLVSPLGLLPASLNAKRLFLEGIKNLRILVYHA